jgi:hypothetical protein
VNSSSLLGELEAIVDQRAESGLSEPALACGPATPLTLIGLRCKQRISVDFSFSSKKTTGTLTDEFRSLCQAFARAVWNEFK